MKRYLKWIVFAVLLTFCLPFLLLGILSRLMHSGFMYGYNSTDDLLQIIWRMK